MKSKVWLCKGEAVAKIVSETSPKAKIEFLRHLFAHPEVIDVQVAFMEDVEVPDNQEVKV